MNTADFSSLSVAELVPHRGAMSWLADWKRDSFTANSVEAYSEISRASIFFDEGLGGISASAIIEFMAQTVALFNGLAARAANEPQAAFGYLLGTRKLALHTKVLPLGHRLRIHVELLFFEGELGSFQASAVDETDHDAPVAEATLSVYRPQK